ncbi:taste receptor type 1 member 1-like [Pholidichthys leucotaenia]
MSRESEFKLEGDYLIGGLFDIHYESSSVHHNTPDATECSSHPFFVSHYRLFQLMRFSVEEINNSPSLLPNVSLGYEMFDHCSDTHNFPGIFKLISSDGLIHPWGAQQHNSSKMIAVVGPHTSTQALTVAQFFMVNLMPMMNYASTSSVFSDKLLYPSFLRTVHPNKDTIEVIVSILQSFNWRWVAFLYSDNDFGIDGKDLFIKRIKNTNICLAYNQGFTDEMSYSEIFQKIDTQKIGVIIVFAPERTAEALVVSAIHLNVTNKVWIAGDSWSLNKRLLKENGIRNIGTVLGVSQPVVSIPGFSDFIYSTKNQTQSDDCEQQNLCNQICNCSGLTAKDIIFANPAFSLSIYSGIYAIAHALHNALQCGDGRCNDSVTAEPHLVPTSLCSPECPVGYRKRRNGLHECCFACEICTNGSYVNITENPYKCIKCKDTEWSTDGSTSCNLRLVEYIPFTDGSAVVIMVAAWALIVMALSMSVLFAKNYNTPVVRSAGGPMCFLSLGCLSLCTLSVFLHFGQPTIPLCVLRYLPFLLFYTVCLACFVVRSFQIISIFKMAAKFPKLHILWGKYHGQWLIITGAFVIQVLILVIGYSLRPPGPYNETVWDPHKIILSCDINLQASAISALVLVSLCSLCFVFSYMGKNLPKNYNEAKAITFCLLLLILTWIIFATVYMLYRGMYIQFLSALAILSSLYCFLLWYFLPKCYIIIFQPNRNTQQYFQGLIQNYTKTISQ